MRISDWSSDVCSSDLLVKRGKRRLGLGRGVIIGVLIVDRRDSELGPFRRRHLLPQAIGLQPPVEHPFRLVLAGRYIAHRILAQPLGRDLMLDIARSDAHTSELKSLMRLSSVVLSLQKIKTNITSSTT